jgi:hypothetical protein
MGLGASAELIWGIPVESYEDGEPSPLWDANKYGDDEGDWREFDGDIEVVGYGHYEDPDSQKGILTTTRIPQHSGDPWTPGRLGKWDLDVDSYFDDEVDTFNAALSSLGLLETFEPAGWNLVASYG